MEEGDIFVGKEVGNLTIVEMGPRQGAKTVWKCLCACGSYIVVSTTNLSKGNIKDCGCRKTHKKSTKPNIKVAKVDTALGCIGKTFGKLTVLSVGPSGSKGTPRKVTVKCECGTVVEKLYSNVVRGITKSCGCLVKYQAIPMIGRTFGELTVVSKASVGGVASAMVRWNCICSCGKAVIVKGTDLRRGVRTHCGCLRAVKPKVIKEIKVRVPANKVGKRFGKLFIESVISGTSYKDLMYKCTCDCGGSCERSDAYFRSSKKLSCGCDNLGKDPMRQVKNDLTGNTYGRLTVIGRGPARYARGGLGKKYGTWTCECECGAVVHLDASKLSKGRYVSCGCLSLVKTTSEKSKYKYRHREKEANRAFRKSEEYHKWRMSVFTRDEFRCVCCKEHKGIQAHHLEDYQTNPELRLDINNGVTLCNKCHKEFHDRFGWVGKTTTEQFTSFALGE